MTINPRTEIAAACVGLYQVFACYGMSPEFEVCTCSVCMTEVARLEFIATPVPDLSPDQIREYSNSAHGVPNNIDDLKAILPRYLELIALGEPTDYPREGNELSRFGSATYEGRLVFTQPERVALDRWLGAVLAHSGWAAVNHCGHRNLCDIFTILSCGGWPIPDILRCYDAAFDEPGTGVSVRACFAADVCSELERARPLWWAWSYAYVTEADGNMVVDWLNAPETIARMNTAAGAGLPEELAGSLYTLLGRLGKFSARDFRAG